MTISNTFPGGALKPSTLTKKIRWPVDETGRNSVIPSMIPSSAASMIDLLTAHLASLLQSPRCPVPHERCRA